MGIDSQVCDGPIETDVVVVGAGPVGAFLACLLGQSGLRATVFERRVAPPERSMAIGVMPPTLRRFEAIDLAGELVDAGIAVRRAVVLDGRRELGSLDFSPLPAPYPFILSLPQSILVDRLWRRMSELPGVSFATGIEVEDFVEEKDTVAVSARRLADNLPCHVRCRYLALCEGTRGSLRQRLNSDRPARDYRPSFVMGDAPDTTGWREEARLFFTPSGSLESFPLPRARRRWVAMNGPDAGEASEADYRERLCERIADIAGIELCPTDFIVASQFTPYRRLVKRYASERVALCGDAAHVMSPIGGQGMNVGLGDAWLLNAILPALIKRPANGAAGDLHTYHRHRERVFRKACRRAAIGMWFGTRTGIVASALRSLAVAGILLRQPVKSRLAYMFSMWSTESQTDVLQPLSDGRAARSGEE